MKYFLLVVFLFVGVTCFGKDGKQGGRGGPPKKEKELRLKETLKTLPKEAQKEFGDIFGADKPFNAIKIELKKFAVKYNIEDDMNELINKVTSVIENDKIKKKVNDVISSMSEKHNKLFGVFHNKKSSLMQMLKAGQDFEADSSKAASLLSYLYGVYTGETPEEAIKKITGGRAKRHTGFHHE